MAQDLKAVYIKHMRHHGCGTAMFQPVAFEDMKPPCCGFFDHNDKWNLIARLGSWPQQTALSAGLEPLKREPRKMHQVGLKWQPKCSKGVRMFNVDVSGNTPDAGVPVGAEAHIKYKSKSRFGAILIARNPVTVTAFNDESLFIDWIEDNKSQLYHRFGRELKKYGLWVVTVTFTAPGCAINAWQNKDKEAILTAKAKASMVGDYGAELDWTENTQNHDWTFYSGDPTEQFKKLTNIVADSLAATKPSTPPQQRAVTSPNDKDRRANWRKDNSPSETKSQPTPSPSVQSSRSLSRKPALSPIANPANYLDNVRGGSPSEALKLPQSGGPFHRSSSGDWREGGREHKDNNFMPTQPVSVRNDGVVMFFDGLHVYPMEWWLEGLKAIAPAFSNLKSAQADDATSNNQQKQTLLGNPTRSIRVQLSDRSNGGRMRGYDLLNSAPDAQSRLLDEYKKAYDPEKDEGVHPSNWPQRRANLVSDNHGQHHPRTIHIVDSGRDYRILSGNPSSGQPERLSDVTAYNRSVSHNDHCAYSNSAR